MPIVALIIIGAAAGFLATRLMKVDADVPTTVAIGVFGALFGGFLLRFLITITGWMAGFVGAVLGAVALIWLWKTYISK
ncbi:MAG: GlsB/YeaQ/YmgE family stress response membrane protein [Paracoccaceae bacterium]